MPAKPVMVHEAMLATKVWPEGMAEFSKEGLSTMPKSVSVMDVEVEVELEVELELEVDVEAEVEVEVEVTVV